MTFAAGPTIIDTLDRRRALPISGDATARHRSETIDTARPMRSIWRAPQVRPRIPTTGIVKGGRILTWRGIMDVTRVGTIAGFGMIDGVEERWDIRDVRTVLA